MSDFADRVAEAIFGVLETRPVTERQIADIIRADLADREAKVAELVKTAEEMVADLRVNFPYTKRSVISELQQAIDAVKEES